MDNNIVKATRQSNFELLRILCALFIIAGHIIMIHDTGEMMSSSWLISEGLRPLFMCAVNAFVLISGYFGIKLKAKKMWQMNDMVTFYSVMLFIVACLWGGHSLNIRRDILFLAPVLTKQYWFITVYFALCLLSPVLNLIVEKADKAFLRRSIWVGTCLFVGVPTLAYLLNFGAVTEDAGYGIVNFSLLYIIGRYIRLYNPFENVSSAKWLLIFIGSSLGCGLFQILYSNLLGFSFTSFLSYNTIFCFVASVAIFCYFQKITVPSNQTINWLSSFCLCSYVIHLHPYIFKLIFDDILKVPSLEGWSYIITVFLLPIGVYVACIIVEVIRRFIFKAIPYYRS